MTQNHNPEWQSWGVQPGNSARKQADPYECSNCPYKVKSAHHIYSYLVGFSDKEEHQKPIYKGTEVIGHEALGVMVVECPKCSTLLYHHASENLIKSLEKRIKRRKSDFLEVPGAYEDFSKMLENRDK